jgi:hypothetical protein
MLILCGSIASFMVNKVINSKALYGRINLEIKVKPFFLHEAFEIIKPRRSYAEIIKYYFVFGGIPKYLKEINSRENFESNINKLCFSESGIMTNEFDKIFYQQFKSAKVYIQIVRLLERGAKTFNEISAQIQFTSGGSLKRYVDNLVMADFISSYYPFHRTEKSKDKKYFLSDEFSRFYIQFIEKNRSVIVKNHNRMLFDKITMKNWNPWVGISFELTCFKHAMTIAKISKFEEDVKEIGKFFPNKKFPVQLDLVYSRYSNTITIFEIKYTENIDVEVVKKIEDKLEYLKKHPVFKNKTIEIGLVYLGRVSKAIIELDYFHHLIPFEDLFKKST